MEYTNILFHLLFFGNKTRQKSISHSLNIHQIDENACNTIENIKILRLTDVRQQYIKKSFIKYHCKVVNDNTPFNAISNVNFDYNGQMSYDFETLPVSNTEPPFKSYVTFDEGEMNGIDSEDENEND